MEALKSTGDHTHTRNPRISTTWIHPSPKALELAKKREKKLSFLCNFAEPSTSANWMLPDHTVGRFFVLHATHLPISSGNMVTGTSRNNVLPVLQLFPNPVKPTLEINQLKSLQDRSKCYMMNIIVKRG